MRIIYSLFFVLTIAGMSLKLHAQNTGSQKSVKQIKSPISVQVIVSDREGRRIPGLKKEDFALFQGDARQNITSFATENEPISVALLLDTSGSTQVVLNKIKEAAKDFIDLLNPNDQCLIATFDSRVNNLSPFNSNRDELKKSLDKIQTAQKDGTIVLSAIHRITQDSFKRIQGRKAIVLLSDGKDVGSDITTKDLLSELEESDVSIYAIHYQSGIAFNKPVVESNGNVTEGKENTKPIKEKKPKPKKGVYTILIPTPGETYSNEEIKLLDKPATTQAIESLKELSDMTAGRFYLSDDAKLSTVFKQVAAELRHQYLLGFKFEGDAEKNDIIKNISVKVDRPNVVVHTRSKFRSKE
jgi:VWFA-related protein